MKTLQIHKKAIQDGDNGTITKFSGYVQFNKIHDSEHNVLGYTPEYIERCIKFINNPNYLYSRQKNHGIVLYGKNDLSKTGNEIIGGIPTELGFLLKVCGKESPLLTGDLITSN